MTNREENSAQLTAARLHVLNAMEEIAERLTEATAHTLVLMGDENVDRQSLLEDLIARVGRVAWELGGAMPPGYHGYRMAYPMEGEN